MISYYTVAEEEKVSDIAPVGTTSPALPLQKKQLHEKHFFCGLERGG